MTYDPFHAIVVFLFRCILLWGFGQLVDLGWHYYAIDPDTPISSAFANQGMEWAA